MSKQIPSKPSPPSSSFITPTHPILFPKETITFPLKSLSLTHRNIEHNLYTTTNHKMRKLENEFLDKKMEVNNSS